MTLLEQLKVSIDTMTLGEKFLGSLQVTLLGVAIVFVALAMLFIIIKILDNFIHQAESSAAKKKGKKADEESAAKAAAEKPAQDPAEREEPQQDEGELVAVISAAVAASLHTSTHNIIVRNIVRTPDTAPAWNRLGRMQQINRQLH